MTEAGRHGAPDWFEERGIARRQVLAFLAAGLVALGGVEIASKQGSSTPLVPNVTNQLVDGTNHSVVLPPSIQP